MEYASSFRKYFGHVMHLVRFFDSVFLVNANQDNAEEKGHQLQFAGDIYRRAQAVIIWVGKGDSRTDELFQITSTCTYHHLLRDPSLDSHALSLLPELKTNKYCSRTCVVQENFTPVVEPSLREPRGGIASAAGRVVPCPLTLYCDRWTLERRMASLHLGRGSGT
jgi:Heterokaryon incompatibility protein (HET)